MIMTYIKQCIIESSSKIVLLSIFLLIGCATNNLETHLKEIQKENSQIEVKGWDVNKNSTTDIETYYSLRKQIGDTTYSLSFSYFKNGNDKFYKIDDYIKSYSVNDSVYEMALLNSDTLYFFKCSSASLNKAPGIPVEFNNLKFEVGKYYYMYKRGRLNWGQKEYFENNMDSLTRIRGNDLPELPDLRLHKKDILTLPEESIQPTK